VGQTPCLPKSLPRLHQLEGIECVLFDAVGTLIFPDPPVPQVYHASAQRFGSRISVDEIRRRFRAALSANQACGEPTSEDRERNRWRQIVHSVIDDVAADREALFESLWQHFAAPGSWRTYDDVATLVELRHRGYRTGIASNFDRRLVTIVSAHTLLAACETVFVSSSVGFTKPDRRFFRAIEEQLGIGAEKIALVGDDEISDVQGATAAGWRAVRLDRSGANPVSPIIRSLADLL
jgi:putative hydrolase of the HAD superfamily